MKHFPICKNCKIELKDYRSKRCNSCAMKIKRKYYRTSFGFLGKRHSSVAKKLIGLAATKRRGKLCASYIDGRTNKKHYCKCGKQLKNIYAKRCVKCFTILQKNRWKNPKNHPRYIDGRGRIKYSRAFALLRNIIRMRDNYTCQKCNSKEKEENQKFNRNLAIHHIDYNKQNNKKTNLITLCLLCNLEVNKNQLYWSNYFRRLNYDKKYCK